jgi:p-hydroxybenzoate 3-monooxygenase
MAGSQVTDTPVGIVGGGPAGLMLSHLLALAGIDSVRSRLEIEQTVRAGILEADSVRLLVESEVSDRVLRDGHAHEGIYLRFGGVSHRIDFHELVDASVWLYPQTDVFIDLAAARERDGGDVRFGIRDTRVVEVTGERPGILFTDADGIEQEVRCEFLVGADGSHSICRLEIPEAERRHYFKEYPFVWFGILAEAPFSAPELVYTRSERGFALISQRSETLQRMYFQCDPDEDVDAWSEDRIWAELQARVAGEDGFALAEGSITDKTVLRFRSFVAEPMRYGNMLLAGDAAQAVANVSGGGSELTTGASFRVRRSWRQRYRTSDFG